MPPEDPNTPFLETPDITDPPSGTGLYCFMDAARPCGSDCMSFLVVQPEGKDYESQQWARCLLLVNAHKIGKHAVALAGQGDSLLKHLRVAKADAARVGQVPPVGVR